MLWPGQTTIKIVGLLLLISMVCGLLEWRAFAAAAFALAGAVLVVLLILVAVELHQDRVLNGIAMREQEERDRVR